MKRLVLLFSTLFLSMSFASFTPHDSLFSENNAEKILSNDSLNKYRIDNIEDTTILQGSYFSLLSNVHAYDSLNNDVTYLVDVSGNFDYSTPGVYEITYSIGEYYKKRTITVLENKDFDYVPEEVVYESDDPYLISTGCDIINLSSTPLSSASYMLDGDSSTRFESAHTEATFSFILDLKTVQAEFNKIVINREAASAKDYNISYSNDLKNFNSLIEIKDKQYLAPNRVDEIDLDKTYNARYLKFDLLTKNTQYGYSIYDLEVYGTKGIAVPLNKYPYLFKDGIIEDNQYLEVEFNSETTLSKIDISFTDYLTPYEYKVFYYEGNNKIEIEKFVDNAQFEVITTKKIRFEFYKRYIYMKNYLVNLITFYNDEEVINYRDAKITCSSEEIEDSTQNILENYNTSWASKKCINVFGDDLLIDLGESKETGKIDIRWTERQGKIYDVYGLNSLDETLNENNLVYRNIHGATRLQSFYISGSYRYLVIKEYSNTNQRRFQIENITINSKLPNDPTDFDGNLDTSLPELEVKEKGKGSYVVNDNSLVTANYIAYGSDVVTSKAVKSNSWWQSLLINRFGHPMYLNPLRVKYSEDGLSFSSPIEGVMSGISYNVVETIDLTLSLENIDKQNANVIVNDYSDFGIETIFKDNKYVDKMVNYLNQGSPYIYSYFAKRDGIIIEGSAVKKVYDLELNPLNNGVFAGNSIIIETNGLSGYEGNSRKEDGSNALYESRFYILNAPENTSFEIEKDDSKSDQKPGKIKITLGDGNYLSIGAFNSLDKASIYHEHGYEFVQNTKVDYDVKTNSNVLTYYKLSSLSLNGTNSSPLISLLPHQHKILNKELDKIETYSTLRGKMYAYATNYFVTKDVFYGFVPQYNEPTNDKYSRETMFEYLNKYNQAMSNGDNMSGDPYWQGKALHPLANAALIADEIGEYDLRDSFLEKISTILVEWLTYTGQNDKYYFVYDQEWGTLYYKNSEFGANWGICDHHFTYGYYAFAASILSNFDSSFLNDYQSMIDFLIKDYMNYDNDPAFCSFRSFDVYAGHSWAGGYADNNGGNNQESAGESLNSWYGAYLFGEVSSNSELKEAAIYGYVTELRSVKEYWFDYDNQTFEDIGYTYGVSGQVYGGSLFFGTFFSGLAGHVYGIQWLPSGEYLSGYALGEKEQNRLKEIYNRYLEEEKMQYENDPALDVDDTPEAVYQHINWVILAYFDPDSALERLDTRFDEVENNNELFNLYYLLNSIKTYNNHTKDIKTANGVSSSVYKISENEYRAICFNGTDNDKEYVFLNENNEITGKVIVKAHSLITVNPFDNSFNTTLYDISDGKTFSYKNYIYKDENDLEVTYAYNFYSEYELSNFEIRLINTSDAKSEVEISVGSANYEIKVAENSNEVYALQNFKFKGKTILKFKCDKNINVVDFRIY